MSDPVEVSRERVAEVFARARRLGPGERERHLEQACAGDTALRQEVESLLAEVDGASPIDTGVIVQGFRDAAAAAGDALGSLPTGGTTPFPAPEARSIVLALDPEGRLGSGVRLRDLENEVKLPELALGAEKYRLLGVLGEGGMGRVYLAYDQDLGRTVALKVMKVGGTALVARFLEEAKVLGQLGHPNIVPVYEVGLTEGKKLYYTMPVVRGRSLKDVLDALRRSQPEVVHGWSLARRVQALIQVAQAVSYAHEKGVVHRDLKPANVMVGAHGEVQVMDWGLAQLLDGGVDRGRAEPLTGTGQLVGTPWYMSPEQARGEEVDARSDVWSLGVMLYELLTLAQPFAGGQLEVLGAIVKEEPVAPRLKATGTAVPLELEVACLKALRKRRDERLESAAAMVSSLQAWLEAEADREKRHQRAEERAAEGRTRLEEYLRQKDEIERLETEAAEVGKRFKGWQPASEKRELVEAEARVAAAQDFLVREASRVVTTLGNALGFEPDHAGARAALADYYWDRLKDAEGRGESRDVRFFTQLVSEYHDGKYARALAGTGWLALDSDPPGAEVLLYQHVEEGFVLVAHNQRKLGTTPFDPVELEMGSYLALLRKEGYPDVRYPVHITRNREWKGSVKLYTAEEIGPGAVYVPAGPFLQGGDPGAQRWSLEHSEPNVDDFFIARHPVTAGEYLEFLNDLAQREGIEAASRRAPRQATQAPTYLVRRGAVLAFPEVDAEGDRWDPRHPALGISWFDALAYCEWRSEREAREHRLPTETEWEKAARGVDGRWFPWGNRFDPSLCNMRESRRERTAPVAVEEFPTDVSVYCARGMAGNVRDWTVTEVVEGEGEEARVSRVLRGGAWSLNRLYARCASRLISDPMFVSDGVGFRWARSARSPRGSIEQP